MREVADARVHGTTGEVPIERFRREELDALRPLNGRSPFRQMRESTRRVRADGCVDVDTNHYSVPWRLIGASVTVRRAGGELRVLHAGAEVARHAERRGRRERAVDPAHLAGIVTARAAAPDAPGRSPTGELLRPLAEYEAFAGGSW
jgi:hypothetical protein